jgi:hypothetical protein
MVASLWLSVPHRNLPDLSTFLIEVVHPLIAGMIKISSLKFINRTPYR